MNPFRSPRTVLAGTLLLLAAAAAAITIRPAQHDFGKVVVGDSTSQNFEVSVPRAATPQDTVRFYLSGNNPIDFVLEDLSGVPPHPMVTPPCVTGKPWPANPTCPVGVTFQPKSLGIKTAILVVTDNRGNQGRASFRGEGIEVLSCWMTVVPCNYAHLYSGSFVWSGALTGTHGRTTINVTVNVIRGVASCSGAQQMSGQGNSSTGPILGSGLFAIEFEEDSLNRPVYNITAACPSPDHPDMGGPSRPAKLGHNEQQTYQQPVDPQFVDLVGTLSYPDPATDALNGVSGTVSVRWDLKRDPCPRNPPPPPGAPPPPGGAAVPRQPAC